MKVAAVGDNCVDFYAKDNKKYPGGNPVNVAVYLRRMGVDASYTGVVGNDEAGDVMKSSLKDKGVDITNVHTQEGNTAVTMVEIIDGDRVFGDYFEGVMQDFKLTDNDINFLNSHDLVVSGLWGHTAKDLDKINVPVVFDFADKPDHELVDIAMPYVDYAFFGLDVACDEELHKFMKEKHAMGPKVIVVTLGENGSIAYDGKEFYEAGIVECEVVDTMGAGDSFIAGFIKGTLENKPIIERMHMGAQSSAVTLGYEAAW